MLKLELIDEIVSEPLGGAHRDPAAAAKSLQAAVTSALRSLEKVPVEKLLQARYDKFRKMGRVQE